MLDICKNVFTELILLTNKIKINSFLDGTCFHLSGDEVLLGFLLLKILCSCVVHNLTIFLDVQ